MTINHCAQCGTPVPDWASECTDCADGIIASGAPLESYGFDTIIDIDDLLWQEERENA